MHAAGNGTSARLKRAKDIQVGEFVWALAENASSLAPVPVVGKPIYSPHFQLTLFVSSSAVQEPILLSAFETEGLATLPSRSFL